MNLNKIETDQPGFILTTWWNNKAGTGVGGGESHRWARRRNKINATQNLTLNESFSFVSKFLKPILLSQPQKLLHVCESTATW